MLKMKALITAILMLGAPALAQQAPAGLSDAGRQTVQANLKERDSDLAPLVAKKRALQKQFDALLTPEAYDEAKLAEVMAEMRSVEGEIVDRSGSSLRSLLKALPDADRSAFFKTLKRSAAPATRPVPPAGAGR